MANNLTLENIEQLLEKELKPIKKTLAEHTETLKKHGEHLDELVTDKSNRDDDKTIRDYRVSRLEEWAIKAGGKINLKFEI